MTEIARRVESLRADEGRTAAVGTAVPHGTIDLLDLAAELEAEWFGET